MWEFTRDNSQRHDFNSGQEMIKVIINIAALYLGGIKKR
jgi:hypothetical protein